MKQREDQLNAKSDEQANQHASPKHNAGKEVMYGLLGGTLLIIVGILIAHFVFGIPFFP